MDKEWYDTVIQKINKKATAFNIVNNDKVELIKRLCYRVSILSGECKMCMSYKEQLSALSDNLHFLIEKGKAFNYINDIYQYESFISEIKKILKKSKVKILSSNIIVDSKTVTWELKVIK